MPRDNKTKTTVQLGDGPEMDAGPMLDAARLKERVDYLIAKHQAVAEIKADIKASMDAAERAGYSKKALAEYVRRALETEEQRGAREAAEVALANITRQLATWDSTPLGRFSGGDAAVQ